MNNLSQPPQPTEPDMALLYFGSLFDTLDYTLPPERDEAKLDALAWHILDKRPKTLLGLAIRARAEKYLCRYLWTGDFEKLPPSDQAARVVIECAMLLSSRPCDRGEFRAQSKTPPHLSHVPRWSPHSARSMWRRGPFHDAKYRAKLAPGQSEAMAQSGESRTDRA